MSQSPGVVAVLAGGTDLLLDILQGRRPQVDTLVDITNISEMKILEQLQDHIFIGAAVTHLRMQHAQELTEASSLIGGPQVRNVATLGGNVLHALPVADGSIALMSLDARVEIASLKNSRITPLANFFKGLGKKTR